MDRNFSKIALWQKASSYKGDEGLTGAMDVQMLSRKAQVKVFYGSLCCYDFLCCMFFWRL